MKATSLLLTCLIELAVTEIGLAQPTITAHPRSITVNAGAAADFSVSATSSSQMAYEWRFRDEVIPNGTNRVLRIENTGLTNLGAYAVRVRDAAGSVESQAANLSLDVTVTPKFVPELSISPTSNALAISWRGEGIVQAAGSPTGPWTDVGGIRKNFFLSTNSSEALFHRLKNPHPRTARLFVPSTYRPGTKLPLIFSLHGYNRNSDAMESYIPLRALAESERFLYLLADGVMDSSGSRFWNAAGGCCDLSNQEINDVAFLRELIILLQAEYDADPKRTHSFGYSNGGFMSYRLAQEHSGLIASIASFGGGMDRVSSVPPPKHPVSVLEVHGTEDTIIPYTGGFTALQSTVPVTGARESVQRWAGWNGCSALQTDPAPSLDLDSSLAGPDTVVTKTTNCASGVTAELWTINNGTHFTAFTPNFPRELVNWLLNHPKPPSQPAVIPGQSLVMLGASLTLILSNTLNVPSTYQWQFNGTNLPGATGPTLVLSNVTTNHAGAYRVTVSNAYEVVTATAAVQVVTGVAISSQPKSVSVLPGTNVIFNVAAISPNSPITYQWQFNGTNLSGQTNATLSITNAQFDPHTGYYRALASDPTSGALSDIASLVVLTRPVIINPPVGQTVLQGATVVLSVTATPDHPLLPLSYRWLRSATTYVAQGQSTLTVTNLLTNTTFRVQVTNVAGVANSPIVTVTVLADNNRDGIADE